MSRTVLYGFYAKLLGDRLGGGGGLMMLGQMAFSSSCAELSGTRSLRG